MEGVERGNKERSGPQHSTHHYKTQARNTLQTNISTHVSVVCKLNISSTTCKERKYTTGITFNIHILSAAWYCNFNYILFIHINDDISY